MAELFTRLELIKSASPYSYPELYYWYREERSSNAEVDFVIQGKKGVVPLEALNILQFLKTKGDKFQ